MKEKEFPRWDLTNIYPIIDSDEFKVDQQKLEQWVKELDNFVEKHNIGPDAEPTEDDSQAIGEVCATFLEKHNAASILWLTMINFVYSYVETDTFHDSAKKKSSELTPIMVKLNH